VVVGFYFRGHAIAIEGCNDAGKVFSLKYYVLSVFTGIDSEPFLQGVDDLKCFDDERFCQEDAVEFDDYDVVDAVEVGEDYISGGFQQIVIYEFIAELCHGRDVGDDGFVVREFGIDLQPVSVHEFVFEIRVIAGIFYFCHYFRVGCYNASIFVKYAA
jgi:hypothetical protein